MQNALVVADDLTGTLDTGHGFAARGRGVEAHLADTGDESGLPTDADVLAVDTDSRDAGPATAASAVRSILDRSDPRLVYKKVDSTLRGNVVPEIDAALAEQGTAFAVVAPAFPSTGRTTRDGVHRVEGTPLAEAGYGVEASSLPDVLSASAYSVEHLPLSVVDGGHAAVTAWLDERARPDGTPVVVACDAVTDAHLAAIAAGADGVDGDPLYVGSGGLAEHVAVPREPSPPSPPECDGTGVLGVVGSVNPRTLDQLAAVPSGDVVQVDPAEAVRDPTAAADAVTGDLRRVLRERGRAVVTGALDQTDTEQSAAAAAALADEDGAAVDAGDRVARALATAAARTVGDGTDFDPHGLVLTGGDIARATLTALGATGLGLTGEAVDDGLPVGWVADGPLAGTRVVTKAGGFGGRRSIVNSIERLGDDNE